MGSKYTELDLEIIKQRARGYELAGVFAGCRVYRDGARAITVGQPSNEAEAAEVARLTEKIERLNR